MRVFVSSLIGGFEVERSAAKSAISTLRHEPIMAEDFGAQANSPQVACLQGLRAADIVILILGEKYGLPQDSGLSATHEEYREAKGKKPILAFVQEGVSAEQHQQAFIDEVQDWEGGLFRESFTDADNLRTLITRALHDYELTSATAPLDSDELKNLAASMLPDESHSHYSGSGAQLCVAIAGGPRQQVIRPTVIEDENFADRLQQAAQFGSNRLLETSLGTERSIESDALVLRQERGASITLDEGANLLLQLPLGTRKARSTFNADASVIVEEQVSALLRTALEFCGQIFDEVDPTQRLTHVAIAVKLMGAEYRAWRTRAEHEASPNAIEVGMPGSRQRGSLVVDVGRPGLRLDRNRIVEEITVRLRRQWRSR